MVMANMKVVLKDVEQRFGTPKLLLGGVNSGETWWSYENMDIRFSEQMSPKWVIKQFPNRKSKTPYYGKGSTLDEALNSLEHMKSLDTKHSLSSLIKDLTK